MGESLTGQEPSTPEEQTISPEHEEKQTTKKYDALIVFGFGARPRTKEESAVDPDRMEDKGWHLTTGTKARVLAAGELWEMGEIDKIVLSEGGTPDKEKSGGELMREYLMSKYPDIPEDRIVVEDKSSNTIENFAGTVDYLDGLEEERKLQRKPSLRYAFLSNTFHMARIQSLAGKFGVEGDGFTAEDVLELAAQQREEKTGIPTTHKYDIWRNRMSSPEGNDVWRDENEVIRREYIHVINSLISQAQRGTIEAEESYLIQLLSKTWNAERRKILDEDLKKMGVDLDALSRRIEDRITQLGKTSYRDYLRQENRWQGGLDYVPEYWLYQAARVRPERFRKMLQDPKNADAIMLLNMLGYHDVQEMNDDEFENMRSTISSPQFIKDHRQIPPGEWDSESPIYN